jgi:uncharacterized SAM-binding protein YcdF (DUF218 family)
VVSIPCWIRSKDDLPFHHHRKGPIARRKVDGGQSPEDKIAEAEAARQYAIQRRVRPDDILVETRSRTTEQNLYYAGQLACQHQLHTLLLVSDPLHMKRAMLIARDMGLCWSSSPTPTSRYQSPMAKLRFLARETHYYQRYLLRRPFYRSSSTVRD